MNQILYTAESKTRSPLPIKTIVRFFAFAIIILGIIFLGEGTFSLFTNTSSKDIPGTVIKPEIEFSKDGNNAIVSMKHPTGINIIKYNWNGGENEIVNGNSKKEVLLSDLSIPAGKNTLYIEVFTDDGTSTKSYYDYVYDGINIEFFVVNNSAIKIVATDISGMSYMTYKWNSEKEVTVYPNQEGDITIEQLTDIPSGENTLHVTAVNSSNITLTKQRKIKGNKRPEISYYIMGSDLYITATDEEGIQSLAFTVNNGEEQVIEANGKKEFTYKYNFGNENILVVIKATDVDGVSKTVACKNY